jgi:hypothetical protein
MIIDGTNGLTFNNATTQASAGVVLQVVNATYSTPVSNSTSTYADTGLTATITPKFATSKILVIVDLTGVYKTATNTAVTTKLLRSSTTLILMDDIAGYTATTSTVGAGSVSANYLDSPATTSATTYKVQFASDANSAAVYVQNNFNVSSGSTSTMTLMEIAA